MTDESVRWLEPPSSFLLQPDEVHVWCAFLDQPDSANEAYQGILSDDELERARRFRLASHGRRFIAARGILRMVLSRYLEIGPRELQFIYSEYGKPALKVYDGQTPIAFNLAHSNDLALYAITLHARVGIDVEDTRQELEYHQIANQFFSAAEVASLQSLPTPLKKRAFASLWTCKEAFIKAVGEGFSYPLDGFTVSVNPDESARLLEVRGEKQNKPPWSFVRIAPAPGYVGAVAVEGSGWVIKQWNYLSAPKDPGF